MEPVRDKMAWGGERGVGVTSGGRSNQSVCFSIWLERQSPALAAENSIVESLIGVRCL
jgi:hypothetical protein